MAEQESQHSAKESTNQRAEIVHLGETFNLFDPQRTNEKNPQYEGFPDVSEFDSNILLDTNGLLPNLPFDLRATPIWKSETQAFTPFNPDYGYQVTTADFNPDTRLDKLNYQREFKDIPESPLVLSASIWPDDTRDLDMLGDDDKFKPEVKQILKQLRLQISFPNGLRFEVIPKLNVFDNGSIFIARGFYPIDARPLAIPQGYENILDEGLQIALPADPEKLRQIEAQFVLSPVPFTY